MTNGIKIVIKGREFLLDVKNKTICSLDGKRSWFIEHLPIGTFDENTGKEVFKIYAEELCKSLGV